MRVLALLMMLGGCYPVCVTDADCQDGYCRIDGEKRECIACDPDGQPCLDGRECVAVNECADVDAGSD